ncbi:MAG: M23 family metallopeptidase [Asticcacaulis sp.]|uniref:M23 family metallopeptidase n=1 Tax=Asticcacaulis sp. TaxID=1872648 RepID=UPI0039E684BA
MSARRFLAYIILLTLAGCNEPANTVTSGSDASASASTTSETSASESASEAVSEAASSSADTYPDFPHEPATELIAGSGSSYTDLKNWAEGICFPLQGKGYANSQVYRPGGSQKTDNPNQCDASNYAYPWQDNFCETRSGTNPMCKNGATGHQGQDIRPETCKANQHWAVAAEDGVITYIGSYTVTVTGNSSPHRIYRYLHMQSSTLKVAYGDHVVRGQKLGLVSNNMGGTATTIHLHFEIRVAQAETASNGTMLTANTFVPPYTALVDAYRRKLGGDCPTVE